MGLYKHTPPMSGRMAALFSLASVGESVVIEFGCMGHMNYGRVFLHRAGVYDGKIYSTHISETDIALGDWSRLHRAVAQIVDQEQPKVIFLLPSAVPEIIGTDLEAIARELAPEYPKVRFVPVSCGGFDADASLGIEKTLLQISQLLPWNAQKTPSPTFNIIGSCADIFNFASDAAEICRLMALAFSMKPCCILFSGTDVSAIERMSGAHINLVIRREGESAAKLLFERFGTPYLVGRPYGIAGTALWLQELAAMLKCTVHQNAEAERHVSIRQLEPIRAALERFMRIHHEESCVVLAGHPDVVEGISRFSKELAVFSRCVLYCNYSRHGSDSIPYLDEKQRSALAKENHGFLMGDEPLLALAGRHESLQISNPSSRWRSGYETPLVGFRGAVNLGAILANEMARKI